MRFEDLQFVGSAIHHAGFNLGLGSTETDPQHVVEGTSAVGEATSIPFSEIVTIRRIDKNGDPLQLEIQRFPDISSQQLLALNPNCDQLLRYRRVIKLDIAPAYARSLYWLGSAEDYADVEKIGRLTDMLSGTTMRLRLPVDRNWWAIIPSILHDPLCSVSVTDPLGNGTDLRPPER